MSNWDVGDPDDYTCPEVVEHSRLLRQYLFEGGQWTHDLALEWGI